MLITKLNIRYRLIAGFGAMMLLLILTAGVGINGLVKLHSGVDQIVTINNPELEQAVNMRTAVSQLENSVHSLLYVSKEAEKQEITGQIKNQLQKYADARDGLNEYFNLPGTSDDEKTALSKMQQSEVTATALIGKVSELTNWNEEALKTQNNTESALGAWLEVSSELASIIQRRNDEAVVEAQKSFLWARNLALACTTLAMVLGVIITALITRSIIRPLNQAVGVASRVASGDLTSHIDVTSNDEIGQLMRSLKDMNSSLNKLILELRDSAEKISHSAADLSSSASQVSSSSQHQSEAASSMAAAVEEMTVGINQITENAIESSRISSESRNLSNEGGQVINDTVAEMNMISDSTKASAHLIEDLALQSEQISGVVKVIKEVADQTNLLALNAAIEAARAGEQGRGFAVVADEVRKLAERTANSTIEISGITDKIKNGIRGALDSMSAQVERVNTGVQKADQAGGMIKRINTGAETVVGSVNDISAALNEQKIASGEIAKQVEKIAQMAEENNAAVEETARTARHLDALAVVLNNAVGRFKVA